MQGLLPKIMDDHKNAIEGEEDLRNGECGGDGRPDLEGSTKSGARSAYQPRTD